MTTDYSVSLDKNITPEEIIYVREDAPSQGDAVLWQRCIDEAICVVGARDASGKLVGVGFLVGNQRHGQVVDLSVHSSVRQNGIGGRILDALVDFSKGRGIKYLGLTFDTEKPWLKGFYERHGFVWIDFAMWEKASL